MTRRMTTAAVALLALAACNQNAAQTDSDDASGDGAASVASNAGGGAGRLHPVRRYCVSREATGTMSGTIEECGCDWGARRYEIQNVTMNIMGMTQEQNQHLIHKDGRIYSWDTTTKRGTDIADTVSGQFASDDPAAQARAFIEAMGGVYTDEIKTIAGEPCTVVNNAQMGGDMCVTDDALVLEMNVAMGPVTMNQIATLVSRNTCGAAANYEVPGDVTLQQF